MAEFEGEDRRSGVERREVPPVPAATAQWWRDPRFYIALVALMMTFGGSAWAIARNVAVMSNNVVEMRGQLAGIDSKLNSLTLDNNSQEKEIEFMRRDLEKLRATYDNDKQLQDTWMKNTREQLIELKARGR